MNDRVINAVASATTLVNTFGIDTVSKEFNELMSDQHRTLQNSFTKLCLKWIEHVASEGYRTDLRNQSSHNTCKELIDLFREKAIKEGWTGVTLDEMAIPSNQLIMVLVNGIIDGHLLVVKCSRATYSRQFFKDVLTNEEFYMSNITYKEVFSLAESKGYRFYLPDIFIDQYTTGTRNEGYGDLSIEAEVKETEQFLELTLIQKWLRDKHKICVVSAPIDNEKYFYQLSFLTARNGDILGVRLVNQLLHEEKIKYKSPTLAEHEAMNYTYESALLEGINAALNLI